MREYFGGGFFPSVTKRVYIVDKNGCDMYDGDMPMVITAAPLTAHERSIYAEHYFVFRDTMDQLLINQVIEKIKGCKSEVEKKDLIAAELDNIQSICESNYKAAHGFKMQSLRITPGVKNLNDDELTEVAYGIGLHKLKIFLLNEQAGSIDTEKWVNAALDPYRGLSHREVIILHNYKVAAGECQEKTPEEWGRERGDKARQCALQLRTYGKNKKPPRIDELKKIIPLLENTATAHKLAINDLAKLEANL